MKRAPEHPGGRPGSVRPMGQRSLRNDIARNLQEGHDVRWDLLRRHLQAAQIVIDACSNWVLIFGPQSLIDEVTR